MWDVNKSGAGKNDTVEKLTGLSGDKKALVSELSS